MANPNPEIWGDSSTWLYSDFAYGLTSDIAKNGNFDKPKVNNFGGTDNVNKTTLVRAIGQNKLVRNEYIDNTICPCGQSPDVSPFSKIAIFNENNDLSATPRIYEITDSNINWFFADRLYTTPSNCSYSYNTTYYDSLQTDYSLSFQQYAPKTRSDADATNSASMQLSPYVYYGTKSLLLSIEVRLMSPDAEAPAQSSWRTLDRWKNDFPTYSCVGMRLFVRNCLSYTNNQLTYNNDEGISSGQAAVLCVTNPIPVTNNGELTLTQFLTQYTVGFSSRYAYIFEISPNIYNYNDYRRNRGVLPCWEYFEGQTLNRDFSDSNSCIYYYKIPYNQANYDKMMSIAALFGCYFTPTNRYTFGYDMLDNDLYLTVLDENGVAHGQYTHGSENANNSLYSKNSIRDIDYDPSQPITPVDTNTYSNITGFNTITNNAALTKFYVLDSANVEKLGDDLWTICDGLSSGDFEHFDGKIKDEFLTTNPIDSIIALKRFPFNIPHTFNPNKVAVQLGKSTGTAQGYRTFEILFGVNFKGVDIFPRFGDCFLDYSPYTKYELYIPFCGTVEINAGDVLGHKLNCQLLIDLLTGSCIAYIMADQLVIGTAKGSCGVDMQMSGAQTATMNANIFNGILNAQLAETQHITSIGKISLNPFKWYENIEVAETRQLQTQHDITHMVVPLHKMGSASPLLSWVQEFNARLMIYYPEGDVITSTIPPELNAAAVASFGHIKGFATATPGKVSSFQRRGKQCFLSGNIIADSIACTDNERQRIIAAFNSGVYLPSL